MALVMPIEARPSEPMPAAGGARKVTVEVVADAPAARDAVTFALALPGTRRAPAAYLPGQFITLAFPSAGVGSATLYRSYSLCGDGRANAPWEITVKRTPGGVISTFLIEHVRPGTTLRASLPQGTFALPKPLRRSQPLIFVAGGSGITPIYAMLRGIARLDPAERPSVCLHYAYHSPADAIFGRELAALDPDGSWLTQHRT
jgi:ferredoxin-NADP reductase